MIESGDHEHKNWRAWLHRNGCIVHLVFGKERMIRKAWIGDPFARGVFIDLISGTVIFYTQKLFPESNVIP